MRQSFDPVIIRADEKTVTGRFLNLPGRRGRCVRRLIDQRIDDRFFRRLHGSFQ